MHDVYYIQITSSLQEPYGTSDLVVKLFKELCKTSQDVTVSRVGQFVTSESQPAPVIGFSSAQPCISRGISHITQHIARTYFPVHSPEKRGARSKKITQF